MKQFIVALLLPPYLAGAVNTAQIVTSSLSPQCVAYRVIGLCYWLLCTPFGCTIRTSVKVRHYRPDLVVSAYSQTGHNPWSDVASLSPPIPVIAEGGGDTYPRTAYQHSKVRFKNADAVGHPAGALFNEFLADFGTLCPGGTRPFLPYFISQLDTLAWRGGIPEKFYPEALMTGKRELEKAGDRWGNLYPRSGALSQTNDYKAAAVVAQRVADIVTRDGQPHIYLSATATGHDGWWPPPSVEEGKPGNHQWQMLAPSLNRECVTFPDGSPTDGYGDKIAADGGYAWTLWRPYSCCKKRGQIFLGSSGG